MNQRLEYEIRSRLERIRVLAKEIEDVPNLPSDIWTMKGIDRKCQEIAAHTQWIEQNLGLLCGTGTGGGGTGSGWND